MVTALVFIGIALNNIERATLKAVQSEKSKECDMTVMFITFLLDLALYIKIMISL